MGLHWRRTHVGVAAGTVRNVARKGTRIIAAVVIMASALSGCGEDLGLAERGVAADGSELILVYALDNSFRPGTLQVEVGSTVQFINGGRNDHNVLPSSGGTAWGVATEDFGPRDTYEVRFDEPGEYPYYCSLHGTTAAGMIGSIRVVGAAG